MLVSLAFCQNDADLARYLPAARFDGSAPLGSLAGIHWVICGGESGPKARAFHPVWGEVLRADCERSGVPFFMKQMGQKMSPKALQVRDFPV